MPHVEDLGGNSETGAHQWIATRLCRGSCPAFYCILQWVENSKRVRDNRRNFQEGQGFLDVENEYWITRWDCSCRTQLV